MGGAFRQLATKDKGTNRSKGTEMAPAVFPKRSQCWKTKLHSVLRVI